MHVGQPIYSRHMPFSFCYCVTEWLLGYRISYKLSYRTDSKANVQILKLLSSKGQYLGVLKMKMSEKFRINNKRNNNNSDDNPLTSRCTDRRREGHALAGTGGGKNLQPSIKFILAILPPLLGYMAGIYLIVYSQSCFRYLLKQNKTLHNILSTSFTRIF